MDFEKTEGYKEYTVVFVRDSMTTDGHKNYLSMNGPTSNFEIAIAIYNEINSMPNYKAKILVTEKYEFKEK